MKSVMKSCVAVLVLAGLTGIATAADLASNDVYKSKCAMCHGANGEGKAAMKTKPFKESASKSDADLTAAINDGVAGTTMKSYKGKLTDAQVKELVAAIKSTK